MRNSTEQTEMDGLVLNAKYLEIISAKRRIGLNESVVLDFTFSFVSVSYNTPIRISNRLSDFNT